MGIYIEDMEMPENSDMIVIYSDGTARKYLSNTRVIIDEAKAVPVPPHGRLIDADALYRKCGSFSHDDLRIAKTVIPASGGGS